MAKVKRNPLRSAAEFAAEALRKLNLRHQRELVGKDLENEELQAQFDELLSDMDAGAGTYLAQQVSVTRYEIIYELTGDKTTALAHLDLIDGWRQDMSDKWGPF